MILFFLIWFVNKKAQSEKRLQTSSPIYPATADINKHTYSLGLTYMVRLFYLVGFFVGEARFFLISDSSMLAGPLSCCKKQT